jgi:hypothetical protein
MRLSVLAIIGIVGVAAMAWFSRALEEEKYSAEVGYYDGTPNAGTSGNRHAVAVVLPRQPECMTAWTVAVGWDP